MMRPGNGQVLVGIETDRGPWVAALVAAGYRVFGVNPMQVARYRERHSTSGAKSDAGDAHALADMVRTDAHQLRPVAGDTDVGRGDQGGGPGASVDDLGPDPARAAVAVVRCGSFFPPRWRPSRTWPRPTHSSCLPRHPNRSRRPCCRVTGSPVRSSRPGAVMLRPRPSTFRRCWGPRQLGQPAVLAGAYAVTVRSTVAVITVLNSEITTLQGQVEAHFGRHPDVEIYRSQPGLGQILGARVLGEFGDDPHRYHDARARKNYAGTSPITRASGKKKVVLARYARNDRLADALGPTGLLPR